MTADIAHLRALLDKASPAPWIYSARDKALSTGQLGADGHVYDGTDWRPVVDTVSESIKADDDGFLIAAAVNALPALLDRLEELEDNDVEVRNLAKFLDETAGELESLQDDIDEHLPEYVLDDGTDEPANYRERIEYAGDEIKRLSARVALLERVAEAARGVTRSRSALEESGDPEPCTGSVNWVAVLACHVDAAHDALAALDEVAP